MQSIIIILLMLSVSAAGYFCGRIDERLRQAKCEIDKAVKGEGDV